MDASMKRIPARMLHLSMRVIYVSVWAGSVPGRPASTPAHEASQKTGRPKKKTFVGQDGGRVKADGGIHRPEINPVGPRGRVAAQHQSSYELLIPRLLRAQGMAHHIPAPALLEVHAVLPHRTDRRLARHGGNIHGVLVGLVEQKGA